MDNKDLFKISLVVSFLGLAILSVAYVKFEPNEKDIDDITKNEIGEKAKIVGVIEDIRKHQYGHFFLTVTDKTGSIQIVVWENIANRHMMMDEDLNNAKEYQKIKVSGEIGEYEGNLQIVADKFELLDS